MSTEGRKGVCVPRAEILSARLSRETMSAARSSIAALGSQKVQLAWSPTLQKTCGGSGDPPSTHRPEGTCTIWPLVAEYASCWFGSDAEHSAVVTAVPFVIGEIAARHVGGVCMLLIESADTTKSSLSFEPRPHGYVHTVAPGLVLKLSMSIHTAGPGREGDCSCRVRKARGLLTGLGPLNDIELGPIGRLVPILKAVSRAVGGGGCGQADRESRGSVSGSHHSFRKSVGPWAAARAAPSASVATRILNFECSVQ